MSTAPKRILIVEDQKIVATDIESTLVGLGYTVVGSASTGEEAIERTIALRPDLVLMDIRLQGAMNGVEAAQTLRKSLDLPILYLTAYADDDTIARAKATGPFGFIVKPYNERELHAAIEIALYKHEIDAGVRAKERWHSAILRAIADPVISATEAGAVSLLNGAAAALTGWSEADARDRHVLEVCRLVDESGRPLLPELIEEAGHLQYLSLPEGTKLVTREGRLHPVEGGVATLTDVSGARIGIAIIVRNGIVRRKQEQARLRLLEAEAQQRAAMAAQRRTGFLARVGVIFAGSLDYDLLVGETVKLPIPILADACFMVRSGQRSALRQVAEAAQSQEVLAHLVALRELPIPAVLADAVREVQRSAQVHHLPDFCGWLEKACPAAEPYLQTCLQVRGRSTLLVPIASRNGDLSVLVCMMTEAAAMAHGPDDLALLAELGERAGLALENALLYQEVQTATNTLRMLIDGVRDYAIFMLDPELHVTSWNAGAHRLEGYPAEEILGRPFSALCPPDDPQPGGLDPRLADLDPSGRVEFEGWCLRKDGARLWVGVVITAVRDATGRAAGFAVVMRDLSGEKRREAARRFLDQATIDLTASLDSSEILQRIAHLAVPELADWCVVDLANQAGQLVQVGCAHVDPKEEETLARIGRPQAPGGAPRTRVEPRRARLQLHARGGDPAWAATLMGLDHETVRRLGFASHIGAPIWIAGEPRGIMHLVRRAANNEYTSTDLVVVEEYARRASLALDNARLYRDARDAIGARDEFLAIASHELKTPLTPLVLQLDLTSAALDRAGLRNESVFRGLQMAARQTERIVRLVESLLDVARLSRGQLLLATEEFDLAQLVSEVADRFRSEAFKAGSELSVKASGALIGTWDRLRIEQILYNLVSNAIKYGLGRPIEVEAQGSEGVVRVSITDHGIGIQPDAVQRIFHRFERAVSMRHYGGLGLGLYIARQIAEAHGGSIVVRSRAGEGSTFTVVLPLQRLAELDDTQERRP